MMRKLMLMAVAMVAVGGARAVTVDWSGKESLMTGGVSGAVPSGISSTDFSMAFVFAVTEPPKDGFSVLTLKFDNNNSGAPYPVTLGFNNNGTLRFQVGSTAPNPHNSSLVTGTHVIGLFVSHANAHQNIQVSVDGGAYISLTYSCNTAWDSVSWASYASQFVLPDFVTNAWIAFAEGKVDSADFAMLPEPTALAFLALGVAGVALRRKLA